MKKWDVSLKLIFLLRHHLFALRSEANEGINYSFSRSAVCYIEFCFFTIHQVDKLFGFFVPFKKNCGFELD